MLIKLEILPSFQPPGTFLLENTNGEWLLTIVKGSYTTDDTCTWNTTADTEKALEVLQLATSIVAIKKQDYRWILDGVRLICSIQKGDVTDSHSYICPEAGSDELRLVVGLVNMALKGVKEQTFTDYIKSIETYFDITTNIKITSTPPYTIRLYGSLSRDEKANVCKAITDVSGQSPVIIDLTNLEDMSTLLFDCFFPLAGMKQVTIIAATETTKCWYWERFLKYLNDIGFDLANIRVAD